MGTRIACASDMDKKSASSSMTKHQWPLLQQQFALHCFASHLHQPTYCLYWGVIVQIKHPGVLKIIEPLEETNAQMVFVTEPVFGSLTNVLTQFREVPTAPDDRAGW